ncbi:Cytochrome c-type biogenesis protein CcmG/DsbE, thiol:disulfide oxidoreductase [Moritella sp. JT01]|uniref:DsbE family thiol:disulfide interchange protein n=1 Tax=Moritella sp. JT01 TaxID=756698 RepID=UPI0007949798|nr:DsbE family thiol:disulfide interchange protein [Moritella sp. JT01]KXO09013.1 Cytochrome c-type biogenesis protein CcmG/DsbE, thiol:disulfide oxidoreductase [Moritella sp. JT01]
MLNNKLKLILPSLLGLLFVALMMFALTSQEGKRVTSSVLVGKPIPDFTARSLNSDTNLLDNRVLQTDKKFTLLNVWASWCAVCQSEHDFLTTLVIKDDVRIVGLNYRDERVDAKHVLSMLGNPYVVNIFDPNGKLALDMGVISTPETYLLDREGIVLYRYSGALDAVAWQHYFKPLIQLLINEK